MASQSNILLLLLLHLLLLFLSIPRSIQLPFSQTQTLLQIQKLLNFPQALTFFNTNIDFCSIDPTPSLTIVCYEDNITQLHFNGNDNAFSPLPQNFSSDALFAPFYALPSLKVLSLVSLGLWGPLPSSVDLLSSLEILNLSSNYFSGSIPHQISTLSNLQTLVLDHNKLTGQVPSELSSLQLLSVISFKNNSLSGPLPNSITSMQNLRVVSLSNNFLFGEIPNLVNLTNLQVLDLGDNHFGPHFPTLPNKVTTVRLRNNQFVSNIPTELGFCYRLERLDISMNKLVGPLSPSLLALPSITYLNIGGNKFTGMLFENMSCNSELGFVNLSSNLLTGSLPTCLQSGSDKRVVLYDGNCLSNYDQEQQPSNFCHNEALAVRIGPRREEHHKPHARTILSLSISGGTSGGIVIAALFFLVIRKTCRKNTEEAPTRFITENVSVTNTAKLLSDAKYISQTMKLGAGLPPYRTFSLEELKESTNNFDASNLMAEEGSLGQVYKGKLAGGNVVAIRSLVLRKRQGPQTYTRQIELISKIRHGHLTSALGHCLEFHPNDSSTVSKIFLVFEHVSSGTLRSYLSGISGKKLFWTQRIIAGIEVVKGIQFLHTGIVPGVYLNSIKITDVLLDQNLHVKLSIYNLKLLAEFRGTMGAGVSSLESKVIHQGSVKHDDKNDVYDIGVILLELILGRPIMFHKEVGVLKDLIQVSITANDTARRSIVDPAIHKECSDTSMKTMMEICARCLSDEQGDRPSVEDVLWNLQFAAQVQLQYLGRADSWNNPDSPVS